MVRYDAQPLLVNRERKLHHHQRAAFVREWREAFGWLIRAARVPPLRAANVTVNHHYKGRTPDVGACLPAAKASIDALVDCGVLPDDSPEFVRSLTFTAPQHGPGHAIELVIEEVA